MAHLWRLALLSLILNGGTKTMPDLSWKDAITSVLEESKEPMHYAEIAEAIAERKLRTSFGATPASTVNATLSMSLENDGTRSPFVRVGRGLYFLRDLQPEQKSQIAEDGVQESDETGLINAFGMYWSRDAVPWSAATRKSAGRLFFAARCLSSA